MPRRGAGALPFLAFSLLAAIVAPVGAQNPPSQDKAALGLAAPSISRAWLAEARDLAAIGAWEAAYALAAEAAAMSPAVSDVRYFVALAGSRARAPLRKTL
ncbi:MAG: hypothetical protein Q8M76_12475, partial [Spirochaetaceae bacterium]|nr:hypothetical protein [Spirochaetaceae bacterium]